MLETTYTRAFADHLLFVPSDSVSSCARELLGVMLLSWTCNWRYQAPVFLLCSFSHVLGIDGDAMHVVAAKEMRDKGRLDYRPAADRAVEDTPNSSSSNINRSSTDGSRGHFQSGVDSPRPRQSGVQTARVSAFCDRDKVR